jgi:hypothetical protein
MINTYSTTCILLSDLRNEGPVSDSMYQIPAIVSYQNKSKIIEIKLFLQSQEFLLTNELLSHSYLENDSFYIPLASTPYLDITHAQFIDQFMIQLARDHLSGQRRNQLTPSHFYGIKSLTGSSIFSIFPRQDLAFQYFDEQNCKESLKIFSFEAPITGKRKFLVSHLNIFHEKYRSNVNRHVYEIIREAYPCRLYFDLEYSKEANPEAHGESIVELWISLVLWKLYELYNLVITSKDIIHLDSSTDKKFSRHLIFLLLSQHPPQPQQQMENHRTSPLFSQPHPSSSLPTLIGYTEHLFSDNLEIGRFVNYVLLSCLTDSSPHLPPSDSSPRPVPHLSSLSTSSPPLDGLWTLPRQFRDLHVKESFSSLWLWNSDHTSRVCVVDSGVYTRNRAFRLLSSTKYGKAARLEIQRVSETKVLNKLIPIPSVPKQLTLEAPSPSRPEDREEVHWKVPGLDWELRSSDDPCSRTSLRSSSKECYQKMISEFTKQFNYFV